MDEIDILKKIKKIIKYTCILLIILCIVNISFYWDFFEKDLRNNLYLLNDILFIEKLFVGYLLVPEIIAYIFFKIRYKKARIMTKDITNLTREICVNYSPAICSFLYSKRTNAYADYSATILDLEQKGYLKILKDNSIEIVNNDIAGLKKHQQYCINCLKGKNNFDMVSFKRNVEKDALDMGLVNIKKAIKALPQILMYLVFILLIIANKKINSDVLFHSLYIYAVAMVVYLLITVRINKKIEGYELRSTKIKLTKAGKEIKEKTRGLKIFMKEYTLLDERNIEEKEVFGEYIAYALALGEGNVVEKFVKENEQYRDLIYKNQRNKMNELDDMYL